MRRERELQRNGLASKRKLSSKSKLSTSLPPYLYYFGEAMRGEVDKHGSMCKHGDMCKHGSMWNILCQWQTWSYGQAWRLVQAWKHVQAWRHVQAWKHVEYSFWIGLLLGPIMGLPRHLGPTKLGLSTNSSRNGKTGRLEGWFRLLISPKPWHLNGWKFTTSLIFEWTFICALDHKDLTVRSSIISQTLSKGLTGNSCNASIRSVNFGNCFHPIYGFENSENICESTPMSQEYVCKISEFSCPPIVR